MSEEHSRLDAADVERMADYLEGRLDAAAREAFERRILDEPALAEALYEEVGVEAVLGDRTSDRPVRRTARPPRTRRRWLWAAPALAAGLALFVWARAPEEPGPPVYRGNGVVLEVVGPRGAMPASDVVFRWRATPGARSYQVELFDDRSRRVLREATPDTFLRSESPVPTTGGQGFWRVVARDSLASTIAVSDPVPLTITP